MSDIATPTPRPPCRTSQLGRPRQPLPANLTAGLHTYARIQRWGSCADCPTANLTVYPERCKNTDRHDHHLSIDQLAYQIRLHENTPNPCGPDF